MSLADVAAAVGVCRSTVHRWETVAPPAKRIRKLAHVLGVAVEKLVSK